MFSIRDNLSYMAIKSVTRLKRPSLRFSVIPAVLLVAVAGGILWILAGIRAQLSDRLANSLQTVLDTTDKAIKNWEEQTELDVAVLADNDDLRPIVEQQLRVNRVPKDLVKSSWLAKIRQVMAPAMKFYQFPGFAIIAPDGVQIAAQINESVGMRDIAENNPRMVARAMQGRTSFGLPFRSPLFVDGTTHPEYPIM